MCEWCWVNYGRPMIRAPEVLALASLAKAAIDAGEEYGAFHIVVSDFNVEDRHIRFCLSSGGIDDFSGLPIAEPTDAGRAFGEAALKVSEYERASALAHAWGYWS